MAVDAAVGGDDVEVASGTGLGADGLAVVGILGLVATLVVHGDDNRGVGRLNGAGRCFACLHVFANDAVAEVATAHAVFEGAGCGDEG